jgi:hypothetical protein
MNVRRNVIAFRRRIISCGALICRRVGDGNGARHVINNRHGQGSRYLGAEFSPFRLDESAIYEFYSYASIFNESSSHQTPDMKNSMLGRKCLKCRRVYCRLIISLDFNGPKPGLWF